MNARREAKPGEVCSHCGQPAKTALITILGDVPTCQDPKTYTVEIQRRYRLANANAATVRRP